MEEILFFNAQVTASSRMEKLNGTDHIVVPVIALKQGVLNGIYYPAAEIENLVQVWNGVPVPVNHPTVNGVNVSANSPQIEEKYNIGKLYNVFYENESLKGEIWIDVEKAKKLGFEEIINSFDNGELMEVSTGLFIDIDQTAGIYNGKKYTAVASNFKPDHLALLPNAVGACSVEDGCGAMRTNKDYLACNCATPTKNKDGSYCCTDCEAKAERGILLDAMNKIGNKVANLFSNKLSHNDIRDAIFNKLDANKQKDEKWSYVIDIFDDLFVFEKGSDLFRQGYKVIENGKSVELVGTAVKVFLKKEYELATNGSGAVNNLNNNGETVMDKEAKVAALIANASTKFVDADKESLMAMNDDAINSLLSVFNEDEKSSDSEGDDAGEAESTKGDEESSEEKEEVTGNTLSDADIATFNRLKAKEETRVANIRKEVVNHYKLDSKIVANMDVDAIEALHSKITPAADYSAKGGTTNDEKGDAYVKPSVVANLNNGEK